MKMKDYELETCMTLQHDFKVLSNKVIDLDTIYNMWSEWSDMCAAGWLGYEKGDLKILASVIEIMYDRFFE